MTGTDIKAGYNITFLPGKGDFGELIGKYGINPGTVSVDTDSDRPIKVDAWDDASKIFLQNSRWK